MSGSVHTSKDGTVFVKWYDKELKKQFKIYRDRRGLKFYHEKQAQKTLSQMQGDTERGVFDVRAYTTRASDISEYLDEWYKLVENELAPATAKSYKGYVKNHIKPFFQQNFIQLHEIRLSHLTHLLNGLKPASGAGELSGKMKFNVMSCLHTCLDYAWRDGIIPVIPPFPKRRAYKIQEPEIKWLPEARQLHVFSFIAEEHQPIFQWLRLHVRRPAEAMALYREDYEDGVFYIKRSISAEQVVDMTKTMKVYVTPMLDEFEPYLKQAMRGPIISEFLFTCKSSKSQGKRYSNSVLNRIWKAACREAGENIDLYSGLRHSRCSQLINEYGLSMQEVQVVADHADIRSTAKYAKTSVARKKELMEGRVVKLRKGKNGDALRQI